MENIVEFKDWEKLDLRVGKILEVADIEGADKLYKLTVDVGSEIGERIICAGIKKHYSKEELVGKKIILLVNLAPRKMRGIESQGMLLASVSEAPKGVHQGGARTSPRPRETSSEVSTEGNEEIVKLIKPEEDVEVGSKVR